MITRIGLRALEICGVAASVLVITSHPTYAYIDPGTGSFVLQAALAGLLGVAFVIKSTWRNLTHAVARILGRRHTDAG